MARKVILNEKMDDKNLIITFASSNIYIFGGRIMLYLIS